MPGAVSALHDEYCSVVDNAALHEAKDADHQRIECHELRLFWQGRASFCILQPFAALGLPPVLPHVLEAFRTASLFCTITHVHFPSFQIFEILGDIPEAQ